MRHPLPTLRLLVAIVLVATSALALAGCGPTGPTWVERGGTYQTTQSLTALYAKADITKLSTVPSADAPKLRHDALTGLRQRGAGAAAAADLVTKTLASDTRSVPVYVEKGTLAGRPALIVIEAAGPANGKLSTKRMWALSDAGAVLFFGTR